MLQKCMSNKYVKTCLMMILSLAMLGSIGLTCFAAETTPVQYSDFESIFTALQGQISVSTVVGVLASVVGVCVGLVFMWWGLRKVVSMLMAAFRKGKVSV